MPFDEAAILLVDDAATVRACLRQILTQLDIGRIHDAASGSRALALLAHQHYDIVFLDIELPDYHGCELLTRIKQQTMGTHVVMCSSHHSMNNVQASIRGGATNFIIKPFSALKVTSIVKHCLRTKTPINRA